MTPRVNKRQSPVNTYHRDVHMRFDDNFGGAPNYEPNSFGGPVGDLSLREPPLRARGDAGRYDHRVGNDDHLQPDDLFRLMPADEKEA